MANCAHEGTSTRAILTHLWGSWRLPNLLHRQGLTSADEALDLSLWAEKSVSESGF